MKKIVNKNIKKNNTKTKDITESKEKASDLSPEEIFEHLQSLSSCDCSSCPKNCFDK